MFLKDDVYIIDMTQPLYAKAMLEMEDIHPDVPALILAEFESEMYRTLYMYNISIATKIIEEKTIVLSEDGVGAKIREFLKKAWASIQTFFARIYHFFARVFVERTTYCNKNSERIENGIGQLSSEKHTDKKQNMIPLANIEKMDKMLLPKITNGLKKVVPTLISDKGDNNEFVMGIETALVQPAEQQYKELVVESELSVNELRQYASKGLLYYKSGAYKNQQNNIKEMQITLKKMDSEANRALAANPGKFAESVDMLLEDNTKPVEQKQSASGIKRVVSHTFKLLNISKNIVSDIADSYWKAVSIASSIAAAK